MDIKWSDTDVQPAEVQAVEKKETNAFKGLVSWVSMIFLLLTFTAGCVLVIALLTHPGELSEVSEGLAVLFSRLRVASLFSLLTETERLMMLFYAAAFLAALLLALLFTFLFRRDRKALERALGRGLGKIWMELKLLLLAGCIAFFIAAMGYTYMWWDPIPVACFSALGCFLLYLLCLDISVNRRFFSHNILHSILKRANTWRAMPGFQKISMRRLWSCLLAELGVILATAVLANAFDYEEPAILTLFSGLAGVVGIFVWYAAALRRDTADWDQLSAQIDRMYAGDLDAVNHVAPGSHFYDCAAKLNCIRTGLRRATDEAVRADRIKVELITNVSHDIKTPLTSIIGYVDLLKQEELPPQARDYVSIIEKKADRLSHIVQDVFEVSKATTGNITLKPEVLDLGKLLRQTLAEMEETLETDTLTWRVDIPEAPLPIYVDGQRIYRVFQNLIRNCTQYSLPGSRVYLQSWVENGWARVRLRNVSRSELNISGDDLTARFVRGDPNRSAEGSGLGLSIAKSFTEACGGVFSLQIDGDLFSVMVDFPLTQLPAAEAGQWFSQEDPPQRPQAPQAPVSQEGVVEDAEDGGAAAGHPGAQSSAAQED